MKRKPTKIQIKKRGYTLVELLVVVTLIGILTAIGIVSLSGFTRRQTLTQAGKDLETDLRATRNRSVSGVDGRIWGIHFVKGSQVYEIFSTDDTFAYSPPLGQSEITKTLPPNITIISVTPNDGDVIAKANVVFDRLGGDVMIRDDTGITDLNPTGGNFIVRLGNTAGDPPYDVGVGAGGKIYEE